METHRTHGLPGAWARALLLVLLLSGLALLTSSEAFQSALNGVLSAAEPIIAKHPFWGAVLFILLSALSAMVAFFSSALLLPVALHAWGKTVCVLLLWVGWMLGGVCAYGLARYWGRPLVRRLTSSDLLA